MRKLVFGETWTLPIGVFAVVGGALGLSGGSWWHDYGGFAILVAVLAVLAVALRR